MSCFEATLQLKLGGWKVRKLASFGGCGNPLKKRILSSRLLLFPKCSLTITVLISQKELQHGLLPIDSDPRLGPG
jgi:hypothetical protein